MVDVFLLDFIHVLVPFLIYLFYIAYKNSFDDKENKLALIITIFSSLYIILKFNVSLFKDVPMFLVCLPLLISCFKKNDLAVVISSIIAFNYYFNFYGGYGFIIAFQFVLFFVIYKFLFDKLKGCIFISLFTLVLIIINIVIIFSGDYQRFNFCFEIIIIGLVFFVISMLVIYLLARIEEMLNLRITAKEIEHDKQVKNTLFQITHEIKNPIAVCKGYLDMFDVNNPKHAKNYIPIIKAEIEKTLVLLEDFLSMNRVRINKEILDINYLLNNFIINYEPYFKENKIKASINISDDEVYIDGDYNRLIQVFTNILKNSIESLKDNPKIDIWTKIDGNKFYIYIKDNGEGIPKDVLDKIKEPFFTTKIKGTGLGVSLSNVIIEEHGGKLLYDSQMGKYTLTTVVLPMLKLD